MKSIEKLLEEAKINYPIGTQLEECLEGWMKCSEKENGITRRVPYNAGINSIWVLGSFYDLCIYKNGKWARKKCEDYEIY